MEWPSIAALESSSSNNNRTDDENREIANVQEYVTDLCAAMITKEIYARAANAAVADITVDHKTSGLQAKVDTFLNNLRHAAVDDNDKWEASEYRTIAREFTELMASAKPRARTLEMCQGGLNAVHDLLKYRLPGDGNDPNNNNKDSSSTLLAAKDAYVLCQSFAKLDTKKLMGSKAPDIDYRFGLLQTPPTNNSDVDDANSLFGLDACDLITKLRNAGQLETSAASLAKHTLTNTNLVSRLQHKTFVILGCDHPLAPTKSLLRIPGVTVLGIASSWKGFNSVLEYAQFNSPDDTTFIYPALNKDDGVDYDGNLIVSRGPHVAQWILNNTKNNDINNNNNKFGDTELVIVPMPAPVSTTTTNGASSSSSSSSSNKKESESAVRWAAASDLIVQRVLRARTTTAGHGSTKCSLWSYQSSTTCMVVPPASATKSTELLKARPSHEPWLHTLSMGSVLTPVFGNTTNNTEEGTATTATATATATANNNTTHQEWCPPESGRVNHEYSIVNGIMTTEGPHHVLAEQIRMWRCMVTNHSHESEIDRVIYDDSDDEFDSDADDEDDDDDDDENNDANDDDDHRIEVHVFAPHIPLLLLNSTSTSTTSTDLAATAATKDHNNNFMEPLRVFDIGTASSLMTAISLAGLVDPIVNRPMPVIETDDGSDLYCAETTPFAMFWNGSVHGGIWNCPYTLNSTYNGTVGYVLGKVYEYYDAYYHAANNKNKAGASGGGASGEGSSSSDRDGSNKSVVDIVPSQQSSTFATTPLGNQPMPDLVRERLEVL